MKAVNYKLRIWIVFTLLVLFSILLVYRLYTIQIVSGADFRSLGENQYVRPTSNLFDRGDIFFSTRDGGRVPAGTLKHGFIVAINPKILENNENAYSKLSEISDLDEDKVMGKDTSDWRRQEMPDAPERLYKSGP